MFLSQIFSVAALILVIAAHFLNDWSLAAQALITVLAPIALNLAVIAERK